MLIDGKKIASQIYENIKDEIKNESKKPKLGIILVGTDPASLRYIKQKQKWAKYLGIGFHLEQLDEDIQQAEVLHIIHNWNKDPNISGFIVQLPLPKHISKEKIIHAIAPEKDVDGFHPENLGKIMIGDTSGFIPCTPAGIIELFRSEKIHLSGKTVCVIGRSTIVGKPITNLLIQHGATTIICNSKTKNISNFTKISDIIIIATGKPHLLQKNMLKEHSIIIDVGFSVVDGKILGDADTNSIEKDGHRITPVPGGVGPMTVAMLMKNTLQASKKN